jgi:chromosome segregation ATPase
MNRNFGIGILVLCFSSSTVNLVRATEVFQVSPIIVQPYEIQELNQQMLNRDRQNRDKEIAIQKLITEDLDVAASVRGGIVKDYKEVVQNQRDKIRALVGKLDEMDQKISHFDEIIAQKDRQIAQLKDHLALAQSGASSRDESIRWLNQVVAVAKNKAEYYQLTSKQNQLTIEQAQEEVRQEENQIAVMKTAIQSGRAQSDQMTLMMSDYQKKLESKNNAYNEQLREVLFSKNDWIRIEERIADLSARLQEKEAQVVKIKKDMYDLQKLTSAKDRDAQAKELSLSIELALARKKSNSTPGSDEINFLREGLKKATLQLKQKDEMILQLKERPTTSAPHENNNTLSKDDRLQEKLKQALDKIDQQGRAINALVQKLQDAGQSVNLTSYFTKS